MGEVSVNGAKNAAVLAATILGAFDQEKKKKMVAYKESMKRNVLENMKI